MQSALGAQGSIPRSNNSRKPDTGQAPVHTGIGDHTQRVGSLGEELACWYLAAQGYRILARNWRATGGELDIVAVRQEALVVVEVKTRSSLIAGSPLESITVAKLARLRRLLHSWVRVHRPSARALRIDAIGVLLRPGREAKIVHLEGVG